jgi:uncharacterized membrane protein
MKLRILFLAMLVLGISFAGLSVNNFTVTKGIFEPGEPGVATVSVTNPAGSERVTSITMSIDNPPEIIVTSSPSLADIDAGGSAIVSLPFRVKEDARPGIYLINVVFKGFKSSEGAGQSQTSVNTVSIPITVVDEPELSLSVDKTLLTGIDELELTIDNNGGLAKNARLSSPGAVSLYGTDQVYLGTIEGKTKINLTLDSRNAPDGQSDVVFNLKYDDELGLPKEKNITLRMTVRNEKLSLRFEQDGAVVTGRESNLTIQIHNDGTETLHDLRLVFLNDSVRFKDQNELKFGDLAPGASASSSALISTNLPPGSNAVGSRVSWIEKDVQKEEEIKVPISITSDADVGVYLEAKPLPLTLGGTHTLSVLVSNLGTYRIDSVDVEINSPALRSLDISNNQYIGGLASDDFSTVQFQESVNATSEGDYPILITVNYRDPSGEWKQKIIQRNLTVYAPKAANGDSMPLIIGLVAVGAIGLWYFRFRKK